MSADHAPATLSRGMALAAAVAATLTTLTSTTGAALAAVGFVGVAAGTVLPRRQLVDAGALALVAGVLASAVAHSSVVVPLVGAVAAVLAWDLGEQSVGLGEQMGRQADTRRLELVRAGTTLLVGLAASAVAVVVYRVAFRGVSFAALVLLLVAAALLMLALRE